MKTELPSPGDIVLHDFRGEARPEIRTSSLRIVQWNIERGYKLQGIIEQLKQLDADVIGLQEIDIQCERSSQSHTAYQISDLLAQFQTHIQNRVQLMRGLLSAAD